MPCVVFYYETGNVSVCEYIKINAHLRILKFNLFFLLKSRT